VLDFYVFGRPAQQGSKSATIRGGRPVMFEDNKRTEPWRALVVSAARAAMPEGWQRIGKAVGVGLSIAFTFDVPSSAPKRRRYWQTTRTSGDIDKLIRSCCDALTAAGVWHDDSQVVRLVPPFGKFNVGEPDALMIPGAHIRIYRLEQV
jgi:Holliday junction resolvase RusA-like endonuclease